MLILVRVFLFRIFRKSMLNTGRNNTAPSSEHHLFQHIPQMFLSTISILIISIGALLNVVFIKAYACKNVPQTNFNYAIAHLSFTNILQELGVLPYLFVDIREIDPKGFLNVQILPGLTCGVSLFFCFAYTSVWILCYLTIKRFLALSNKSHHTLSGHNIQGSNRSDQKVLACIWIMAIILIIPHHLSWEAVHHEEICHRRTDIFNKLFLKIYGIIMALVGLIIPVVIMLVCLCKIKKIMYQRTMETADIVRVKYRKKVTRVLIILVLTFCFSWAPWSIYWVIRISCKFSTDVDTEYHLARCRKILILPCLMAGIISPISYGCSSKEFRSSIQRMVCLFRKMDARDATQKNNNMEANLQRDRAYTIESFLDMQTARKYI